MPVNGTNQPVFPSDQTFLKHHADPADLQTVAWE